MMEVKMVVKTMTIMVVVVYDDGRHDGDDGGDSDW
jgi:hypothetical protein